MAQGSWLGASLVFDSVTHWSLSIHFRRKDCPNIIFSRYWVFWFCPMFATNPKCQGRISGAQRHWVDNSTADRSVRFLSVLAQVVTKILCLGSLLTKILSSVLLWWLPSVPMSPLLLKVTSLGIVAPTSSLHSTGTSCLLVSLGSSLTVNYQFDEVSWVIGKIKVAQFASLREEQTIFDTLWKWSKGRRFGFWKVKVVTPGFPCGSWYYSCGAFSLCRFCIR